MNTEPRRDALANESYASMKLLIGKKVNYPSQGPCLIDAIEEKLIGGKRVTFYQLQVLNEGGGKLLVPANKVENVGIRPLLKKTEIPGLLERLRRTSKSDLNCRDRIRLNMQLLATGSAFDLAEVVESLTDLREKKSLSFGERKTLEKARCLLICEISEVLGETRTEAEVRINQALEKAC
ncbi:MAG: CarD family transcriptional regulator [Acidobacteriota bacterium]